MCNGYRHPAGCDCGFGPPYPGRVTYGGRTDWIDEAASSKEHFNRRFRDLAVPEANIVEYLAQYDHIAKQGPFSARWSLTSWIDDLWKRLCRKREYRKVEERDVDAELPLFVFCSPMVGTNMTYAEDVDAVFKSSWSAMLYGVGTGFSQELHVHFGKEFESRDAQPQMVYATVRLHLWRVEMYDEGRLIGTKWFAEVGRQPGAQSIQRRGCRRVTRAEWQRDCSAIGDPVDSVLLARYPADHVATSEYDYSVQTWLELGFKLQLLSMKAEAKRGSKLTLRSCLRGGHDYHLVPLQAQHGFRWQVR